MHAIIEPSNSSLIACTHVPLLEWSKLRCWTCSIKLSVISYMHTSSKLKVNTPKSKIMVVYNIASLLKTLDKNYGLRWKICQDESNPTIIFTALRHNNQISLLGDSNAIRFLVLRKGEGLPPEFTTWRHKPVDLLHLWWFTAAHIGLYSCRSYMNIGHRWIQKLIGTSWKIETYIQTRGSINGSRFYHVNGFCTFLA